MEKDFRETLRTTEFVRYSRDCDAERCVIMDLDDTLAKFCKIKRLSRCHEFEPMQEQLELALSAQGQGIAVVIASARPEWAGHNTFKWLNTHGLTPSAVYLRNRQHLVYQPEELKEGMLRDILSRYKVEAFHDDAPNTIRMAQSLGVNGVYVKGNESYWASKGQVPPADGFPH